MKPSHGLALMLIMSAPAWAQNLLSNPSFESDMTGWTQFGGGEISSGNHFGLTASEGDKFWNVVHSFASTGNNLWGVRRTINLIPGSYTLSADGQAHNRSGSQPADFAYIPGQQSSNPTATIVRMGYSLSGDTDVNAAIKSPEVNTGARYQRLNMQFTVSTSGPVCIFLMTRQQLPLAGNWSAFDNVSLSSDDACPAPTTVTGVQPALLTIPPPAGNQLLTISGSELHNAAAVKLSGPATITGVIQSQNPTELTAQFDLTNAPLGVYNLIAERGPPCTNAVRNNAFTLACVAPAATMLTVNADRGRSGNAAHVLEITGVELNGLTALKLRKSNHGNQTITGTNLTMVNGSLRATFDLTGVEGGRYDVLATHPCGLVNSLNAAFLVYMPVLTNASFEEGVTADPTSDPLCDDPGKHGNRPKPKHWDQYKFISTALGSFKRDGNVFLPECVGGNIKNITDRHFAGIDAISEHSETVSFFQTIDAGPLLDQNRRLIRDYNIRAELAINGMPGAFAKCLIRLIGTTERDGDLFPETLLAEKQVMRVPTDAGLIADPDYNAVIPAGTLWPTVNPSLLTIEFRFVFGPFPYANPYYGFWVDGVRTGSFIPVRCSTPFADVDTDGDVDQDDFAVFQLCYTGESGPLPTEPSYCGCFDRNGDQTINLADYSLFQSCASGPAVPWSATAQCPQ